MDNKQNMTLKVDISTCINRIVRDNNKAIYYNDDCICVLGGHEIKSIGKLLEVLYEHYLEHKEEGKWRGLTQEMIHDKTDMAGSTISQIAWKLTPQFVNVRTDTKVASVKRAKFHTLNRYGIMLVEKLIEKQATKSEKSK